MTDQYLAALDLFTGVALYASCLSLAYVLCAYIVHRYRYHRARRRSYIATMAHLRDELR